MDPLAALSLPFILHHGWIASNAGTCAQHHISHLRTAAGACLSRRLIGFLTIPRDRDSLPSAVVQIITSHYHTYRICGSKGQKNEQRKK